MEEYIPKSAVVAEIEKFIERAKAERVLHPKTILAAKNYLLIEDYNKLLSIIDTLEVKEVQEEPVSEDLDSFAKRHADEFAEREYEVGSYDRNYLSKGYYWGCKAGANWQKEQMMKDAISAKVTEIYYPNDSCLEIEATLPEDRFEDGDKVLIIKDE